MEHNNNNEVIDILGALEDSNDRLESLIENKAMTKEIEVEDNIKKDILENTQETEKNTDENIYQETNSDNILNIEDDILKRETETKKTNSFLSAGIFGIKYIVTSAFIFSVLLLTTNYSAYSNIAKSYIYEDEIKQESISLINGAEASNIIENHKNEEKTISQKAEEEEKEVLSKSSTYSRKKIIPIKSKKTKRYELMKKEEQTSKEGKRFSITKLVSNLKNEEISLGINIIPYENRIIIPKIGKNVPLIDIKKENVKGQIKLDNILMKELEFGVVRYPGSAKPGNNGNSFIFGHSSNFPWIAGDYNDVFARLGQMEKGDIVYSYYNQKRYKYKIVTKKIVKPNNVSILKRDKNKKELTLMTCWPVGTTLNRLILIGELIEE